MTPAGGWILVPVVLALACTGIGLLAERLARIRLPGALVPGVGLAGLIALAGIPTVWDATAEATVPLVAAAALAGFAMARPWRDGRLRGVWPWPLLAAGAAFAVFAAPSLLTGQASIAGYVKLDDSATWLALTDHVFHEGRDLSGLAPSSHREALKAWLGSGYPVGAFLPLGTAAALTGQDVANAYQPVIAVYAAIAALGLFAAARSVAASRAAAAGVAALGVQASLFLGYAQWGGIKEAATVALLPPLALGAVRSPVPAVIGAGAMGGVYGVDGMAWGAPALLLAAVVLVRARTWRRWTVLASPVVLAAALVPVLSTLHFAEQTAKGAISAQDDFGNLTGPLSLLQGVGLWPAGDFRAPPDPHALAVLLAVAGLAGAGGGVALAVARRRWELPALVAVTLAGAVPALVVGSPWVDAKALAITSPVLLCATGALVAAGLARRRPVAVAGAAVLGAAAAWSTLAVIRDVAVAPRARLAELRDLAPRLHGPTVVLDFEIYADRHFLRASDPEGATDLRYRPVARRDGSLFDELGTAEVDDVATPDLWVYRTIVRRRSPTASRPPAAFRRVWAGRFFEAWERPADAPPPVQRLPLATGISPVAVPDCEQVAALARTPGVTTLAAARRPATLIVDIGRWTPRGDDDLGVPVDVPSDGVWRVWVGGALRAVLSVTVDGREVGSLRHELAHDGQWLRYGAIRLKAGRHSVVLRHRRGLRAGMGPPDGQSPLGPLALTAGDAPGRVVRVEPERHRDLCDGRALDWVEGEGPAG